MDGLNYVFFDYFNTGITLRCFIWMYVEFNWKVVNKPIFILSYLILYSLPRNILHTHLRSCTQTHSLSLCTNALHCCNLSSTSSYYIYFNIVTFIPLSKYVNLLLVIALSLPMCPTIYRLLFLTLMFVLSGCHSLSSVSCCLSLSVAEWLRAWDTLTMFEATVCGRSWVGSPRPGQYSRMSFSSDPGDWYGFLIWTCLSFQILNLFRTLSSWGSGNYRPSAPFIYEVASHVKNCYSGHYYYYY